VYSTECDNVQLEELSFIELSHDGSLTILGAQPLDTGDYRCVALNQAGSASDVVQLDVGCTSFIHTTCHVNKTKAKDLAFKAND